MKSTLTLNITIEHGENLPVLSAKGTAEGIAALVADTLTSQLGRPAVTAKVYSACITGQRPMTIEAVAS